LKIVSSGGEVGRGMKLVPRRVVAGLVGLAAGCIAQSAYAGGISPGNGGPIELPSILPHSVRDSLASASSSPVFDSLGQKFGVEGGRLDFFSMPPRDGSEFKPSLRAGVGAGRLGLQLKW